MGTRCPMPFHESTLDTYLLSHCSEASMGWYMRGSSEPPSLSSRSCKDSKDGQAGRQADKGGQEGAGRQ